MEIIYQDTDITNIAQVRKCIYRDASGDRCDSLEIEMENAAGWYNLGPKEDDTILVSHGGLDTGTLYVNTIVVENGKYRIIAASLPCAARTRGNRSFTGMTIEQIMRTCAMESGMDYRLFGIEGGTVIPYIQRENEGNAAFLRRLMKWEGAALKCVNGRYTAIGIPYAQDRAPHQTLQILADRPGAEYKRDGMSYRKLSVETPYASAVAVDTSVPAEHGGIILNCLPARNNVQAGRWARNMLLDHNRRSECLTISMEFNIGLVSMTRIDIIGDGDTTGEWLIEEASHDLYNMKSTAKLRRCISSIR